MFGRFDVRRERHRGLIHPTALVDATAELAENVSIGPYSVIGANVSIDSGTVVDSHCSIQGPTRIGKDNHVYPFCSLGEAPQDKKYDGEDSRLEIGDRNTIREYCTFNRGTGMDLGYTRLGSDNWIMAYCHIAHDCVVGDNTIFANAATIAGHVSVGDYAIFGAFTCVHQFVRIGAHSFTGMHTLLTKDLPPYVRASGNPAEPHGLNTEGLQRRGFDKESIKQLRAAYKLLYRSNLRLEEAKQRIGEMATDNEALAVLATFLNEESKRSITR